MTHRRRSLLLPAMWAVAVALFFVVLFYERWLATRVRPPPAPVAESASEPAAASARVPVEPRPSPSTLHRCVGSGAPVYTSEACPPGMRLDREIAVAPVRAESPGLRGARQRCEAGKQRRELELAKLGARRTESDNRLWGDYAARECAEYTARAR